MKEAFVHQEEKQHSLLQALWVHRYGLTTLPKFEVESKAQLKTKVEVDNASSDMPENEMKISDCQDQLSSSGHHSLISSDSDRRGMGETNSMQNDFDEISNAFKIDDDQIEEGLSNLISVPKCSVASPPPPPRSLNHLRRWLPSLDERDQPVS